MSEVWTDTLPVVKSKAELVYESLRRAIAHGDLRPGERVNMDTVARTLGVSKIPVREAVKRLQADGLLVSRLHSGVSVAGVDAGEMRAVYLAREAIETLAATLAVERITDGMLAEISTIQQDMHAAFDAGAIALLAELNAQFHSALARAAGYRVLSDLTEQLLLTVRRYRVIVPLAAEDWRSVIVEHDAIVDALRRRDPAVSALARVHLCARAEHELRELP